jgi:hypothetical protein
VWFLSLIQTLMAIVAPDHPLVGGAADSINALASGRRRLHEEAWQGFADVRSDGRSRLQNACRELVVLFASENGLLWTEADEPEAEGGPARETTLVIEELDTVVSLSAGGIEISGPNGIWRRTDHVDHGSPAEMLHWVLGALNALRQPAHEDSQTAAPIRAVVLFNLGPAFGGFRVAVPPGTYGLDHPEAFEALEDAIDKAYALLAVLPPERWRGLSKDAYDMALPRLDDRVGVIHGSGTATSDAAGAVVLRASFPFRFWPLGGWVVYDGRHRSLNGTWSRFTHEELDECW